MLREREIAHCQRPPRRLVHTHRGDKSGTLCLWRFGREACGLLEAWVSSLARLPAMLMTVSLLSVTLASAPAPAEVVYDLGNPNNVRRLVIAVNKSDVVRLDRTFGDLLVGNAEIADVVPLTTTSFYVLGKKIGATRISIVSQDKTLLGVVDVDVAFDIDGLRSRLNESVPGNQIRATSVNGKVLLTGVVPDSVALATALAVANQFAPEAVINSLSVRASQQVLLEVRFLEAARSAVRDLGVNWRMFSAQAGNFSGTTGLVAPATPTLATPGVPGSIAALAPDIIANSVPFGSFVASLVNNNHLSADVVIQALEERGLVRRLAQPNLIALSGDTASFLAGGEFPFPVAQQNDTITIEFKQFGVGLGFTPTVLADGLINLKIAPEVSEIDPTQNIQVNGTVVPGLVVRRAQTTVELRDGQSFAIAGLLQSTNIKNQSELPWIGRVPVLGTLFRSAHYQKQETDLVVIVTPHLAKPATPGEALATPLDGKLNGNDVDLFLKGKQEVDKHFVTPYGHILEADGWAATVKQRGDISNGLSK
jgi:pilus assembly protein CpaC